MERNGLTADVGTNMLFADIERERNNSNAKQLQTSTAVYGQPLLTTEQEVDRANANLHFNGLSQAGSLPNPLNGFPIAAYNQSPLLWQFLSSPMYAQNRFRHPLFQADKVIPPFSLSTPGETSQLRCEVCGLACGTIIELREHITRKHLTAESEIRKERRESISKPHSYREENSRAHTPQRKDSGSSSSHAQDSDKKSPTNFPIPTPNFTLLSSYSKLPSLNPPIGTSTTQPTLDPTKMYAEGVLPSLLNHQLKSIPLPMLPNAYNILSPLLAFQNMMNSGDMPQTTSAAGKLPQGLAMGAATNYPYLRYSSPGGRYLPGNLPFLPAIPVMLPPTSVIPTPMESPSFKEKDSFENVFSAKTDSGSEKRKELKENSLNSNLPNVTFSSPHAESLRRRLSVPVISLNKDFRAPHPYSRKPSVSSGTHCSPIQEQNNSTAEQLKHPHTNSQCHDVLSKNHLPLTEKSGRSHPNAKSIEQHISKLISNNEKVLLNPALERVKPRRVFRRNSLDPASLSSYAAAITGCNTPEAYFKEESSRKLFSESDARFGLPVSSRTHFPTSTSSDSSFPPGMSPSEYESLVQLTRVSQSNIQLLNTMTKTDLQDHIKLTTQHHVQTASKANSGEAILGKRDSSPFSNGGIGSSAKKPRRATFFECSDCGVRYRKEDNYKIHKHIYCKFKKDFTHSAGVEKRNRENIEQAVRHSRRHSDLPEVPAPSMAPVVLDKYPFEDVSAAVKSAGEIVSRDLKVNADVLSNGKYTKILASNLQTQLYANPMKALHNDLFRTKSAEATLQTKSALQDMHLLQAKKNASSTKATKLIDSGKAENLCGSFTTTNSPLTASALFLQSRPSVLPPPSSIPPNKLPPNKRHLMRLFEQGNVSSDAGQMSVAETDPSSPVGQTKLDIAEGFTKDTATHPHQFSSNTELTSTTSSSPSVTPNDDIFLSPSLSNVFAFDEASAPRSNYKLLLHEISLRNMHDIGFMKNLSHNKSVWSWQQIQKGFLNQESSELLRHKSSEAPPELSQNHRKFSVPSRLARTHEKSSNGFQILPTTSVDKPKTNNDTKAIPQSGPTHNPTPTTVLSQSSFPSGREETSTYAASLCSSSNSPSVDASQGSGKQSLVFPMATLLATKMPTPSERLDKEKFPPLIPSEKKGEFDGKPVVDNDNNISSEKKKTSKANCLSAILFPHLKPTLTAKPHASFCCMVSPQPTCMEIPEPEGSKSTQVSMYSDWAVSEPILIPSDLTISDVLTKWRRPRAGYRDGVTTMVENDCQLILTEHKAYEKFKKDVKSVEDESNTTRTDDETAVDDETLNNEKITIPVLLPSGLFESHIQPIYACCHKSQGTCCSTSIAHFNTSAKTGAKDSCSSVSNATSNSTVARAQSLDLKCANGDLVNSSQASQEDPERASRDSASSPDQNMLVAENTLVKTTHSSCDATESDSDPIDVRIEFFGKVKRRRTRRERTALSPREKRRALECISPLSPSAAVLPVHQGNACSNATEDKLRGCALCSIKAGRADLITDADSACQPCRDAALKKNDQPTVTTQKPCTPTPTFYSSPATTSGFLDKARASSGNTQHWVSNNTPEITEHPTQGSIFRYPSPRSSKSSASESMMDATTTLPQSCSSFSCDVVPSKPEKPHLAIDVSKASAASSAKVEQSPAAVSPSLAEVVSEVMRTAAMQSKRQNKSAKHHHLLSKSRALLPGSLPSSPLLIEHPDPSRPMKTNSPVARQCLKTTLSTPYVPTTFTYAEKESQADIATPSVKQPSPEHTDLCEITVTPATPPACSSKSGDDFSSLENTRKDAFSGKPNSCQTEGADECSQEKIVLQVANSPDRDMDIEYKDDGSYESDEDGVKEDIEGSPAADGAARPFICPECKVAFRIGGHLAKHLRSKGHAVAMQKKTLNRLKMRQIQMCITNGSNSQLGGENEPNSLTAVKDHSNLSNTFLAFPPGQGSNTFNNKNKNSELLDGAEGLARSQVRALLEGSEEYACVPASSCDDVTRGEISEDMGCSQDPRPFKCIACKVAFRFQGHLDRHFRSNAHLIAVGHYEQDMASASHQPTQTAINSSHDQYLAARDKGGRTAICDEQSIRGEHTDTPSLVDLSSSAELQIDNRVEDGPFSSTFPNATASFDRNSSCHSRAGESSWSPPVEVDQRVVSSRVTEEKVDVQKPGVLLSLPGKPRSPACREQQSLLTDEQVQSNTNMSFKQSAPENGLNRLTNHQPVTQLHMHSNDQSDSSVPLRSSDRLPHKVVLPCQVSCT